ncbi:hypothetical protein [Synechocystis sp. PCC 7509]|uniref:hypothetical protein n=1 Tax=Synechocystis sp. PCC 7509 TaxID=927677 RepID=UPI0002AC51F2|nr:hypothetical protein [Synechocystis sp. PCC 7509]
MSTQAPQLDKGEMAAAERANLRLSEQIMVLMAKALRNYANNYPSKVQKTLSDPKAETKVDISMGNEKLLSATLGADNKIKETRTNTITDEQAQELAKALFKQQGEMLEGGKIRDIRVLVNGVPLFEAKDGKVLGNNLPPEFQKAIAAMVKPKPLEISVSTNPPKQATQEQQQAPGATNPIPNVAQKGSDSPIATNPIPDVAQKESNSPTATKPTPDVAQKGSNSPIATNPIPDVAQNQSNPPTAGQEQLNRNLIAEAKKSLDRLVPDQSAGNRQWKHEKYTLTQKDGVTSIYVAETKATIRTDGNAITGNARQKDVEALGKVNATIDQQLGKPAVKQTGAEL